MASVRYAAPSRVGKAVGWRVEIAGVKLDHRFCWADVGVSLDSNLTPGSVELDVRGVTAAQFATIAAAWTRRDSAAGERRACRNLVIGKLSLFWRDIVGDEPAATKAPVLVEFALTALSRRSEGMQIVTRIEGRHALYERFVRAVTSANPTEAEGPLDAAAVTLQSAHPAAGQSGGAVGFIKGTDFQTYPPDGSTATSGEEVLPIQKEAQVLAELNHLGDAMLRRYGRRGRGVYLLRDGKLHIGPFWPVPYAGAVSDFNPKVDFVSAQMHGEDNPIGGTEARTTENPFPAARDVWKVQCVGRADIGPGDLIRIRVPSPDAGLSGGFGLDTVQGLTPDEAPETVIYVSSVRHTSAPNRGWMMEIAGVTILDPNGLPGSAWDVVSTSNQQTPSTGEVTQRADAGGTARSHVGRIVAEEMAGRPQNDIGEVRAFNVTSEMSGANTRRAAQSSALIVGVNDTAGAGAARKADLVRAGNIRRTANTPYLTPFAWGPFGHVLPRYPGTRVMVAYHHNSPLDAVDIGALWRSGDGGSGDTFGPANAQFGDWWLILPAGVDVSTSGMADPVSLPADAHATHDLIDASGERIIEVKGFTIRSYGQSSLNGPAHRPQSPAGDKEAGGIRIEHVDSGALISITTDGKIIIKAKGELALEGEGIKLRPGGGTVDVE